MGLQRVISGGAAGAVTSILAGTALLFAAGAGAAEPVVLDAANRTFIKEEMGQYVEGLRQAIGALAKDDHQRFAAAVRPLGMVAMQAAPGTLMEQLPMGFKRQGMQLHQEFDRLATGAEQGVVTSELLAGLSAAMERCGGCHASYRIEVR